MASAVAAASADRSDRPRPAELRFDAIGVSVTPAGGCSALDHLEDAF